jgi:hypothetical protein
MLSATIALRVEVSSSLAGALNTHAKFQPSYKGLLGLELVIHAKSQTARSINHTSQMYSYIQLNCKSFTGYKNT